jgi:predicted metalloendopeptidase
MDRGVAPGDDFFQFANGTWEKTTEIPKDRSNWGRWAELGELTSKRTAELIAEAAKQNAAPGSDARKVGDYYTSFMDEAAIEGKGLTPLASTFAAIAALHDSASLARYLGSTLRTDVDVLNSTDLDTDNLFGLTVPTRCATSTRGTAHLVCPKARSTLRRRIA